MSSGVEIDAVLKVLSQRIGNLTVECEVAKLELEIVNATNASLINQVQELKRTLEGIVGPPNLEEQPQ